MRRGKTRTLALIKEEGAMRTVSILLGLLMSMHALADAKAGEKKAQLCLLCHKPGNPMASAPLLEAQPSKYLVQATTEYKTGKRPDPVMKTNVANLSARDIKDIADYFASRPPVTGVYSTDPAKVAVGEKRVAELKCASCHGPSFAGAEGVPRLAGQTPGYLVSQLEAFAAGRRPHPPVGTPFNKLGDIEAIAHYFTAMK
jgi:cytochrome c553